MPSLDEYRARYDDLRSLSDADAIQQIAKVNGVDVGDVTSYLNYEPPGGDFLRQLKNSWTQTKQLGAGLGAAAAATAETSFGEGGLATGLKKAAVEKYKEIGNELQINSKASDSLSYSWEEAHKGNFGALVDWTQGAFGMGIGQIGQAIGTAGVGGIIGRTVGKKVVEGALSEMVEKEAKRLVLNNVAEDEAKKQAVGNVASRIGQNAAIGAQVLGMEGGEIGGDLAARATEEGRILTGAEIARALAATVVAAGPEAITERWALDAMTGKLPWLKAMEEASGVKGKTARAGMIGAAGATIGAGQEFTQTYIEEAGKGNEINDQTLRMAIDAAGMGAVGGAIPGVVGGLVTRPNEPAAQAPSEEAPPNRQVTLAELEQMRTQRLAQLDQEERGHEGGVVTNPEGGIDVIAPKIGRELSPQEKGERLFLTKSPPEAIAKRYGLEIAKPADAEIAAPIIAAQDEDQAIAEFEKAASANVPAIESQKVDILGDAGRDAERALRVRPTASQIDARIGQEADARTIAALESDLGLDEGSIQADAARQSAFDQAQGDPELQDFIKAEQQNIDIARRDARDALRKRREQDAIFQESLSQQADQQIALSSINDVPQKTAMQIAFERAQQQSAARQPPADQAQATQPTASMDATVAAQQAVTAPQASIDAAPQALPEATQQAAPVEQRNPTRQERIAQMTPADIEQELYVSRATGIKNRRALDEDMQEGKKAVTFIDLDGLKYINDTLGHEKGNELLKKFADAMKSAGIDGYHVSGDEFAILSDNMVKAKQAIKSLEAEAKKARIDSDTDSLQGITFSYGMSKDLATADANMQKMKASREQAGLRVRGGRPPNLVSISSQPAPQPQRARSVLPTAEDVAPLDAMPATQMTATSELRRKVASRPTGRQATATTPAGRSVDIEYRLVEAGSLVASNDDSGAVNPQYPAEMQPRDRSRAAAMAQVDAMSRQVNPALLGDSPTTTDGAPIVAPDGVVESGNGRTLALRRAYRHGRGESYRKWLSDQGYDVEGMAEPVLVRVRRTQMTPSERVAYARESNERTTLEMSATEQAATDAEMIRPILSEYHGGDVASAANAGFARKFVAGLSGQGARGGMMDSQGLLSQGGRRRIEAALLSSAYGDPELVADVFESADTEIKAIGGALLDAAGRWAMMREAVRAGATADGLDVTQHLIDAVNLVRRARSEGRRLSEVVGTDDILSGRIDPMTEAFLRIFYRTDPSGALGRARGREKVADALTYYADQSLQSQPGEGLLGDPLTAEMLIGGIDERLRGQEQPAGSADLFAAGRADNEQDARAAGEARRRPGAGAEGRPDVGAAQRGERGAESQEGFSLTSQTEAQRTAEEARKKAEKKAKDEADAAAEERARVDREAGNFELGAPTNQSDLQEQEIRQKADAAEAKAKAEEAGDSYPLRSRKESSDRWIEVQTGRKAPDEHQQKIMDAAQAARDAGITTLRETERFIDSRLPGYFPEGLGRGNGSSMASEVSFALRALDMLGASRREKDAASRLDLRPGQKVGDITINTGRKLRAAQVESIEDGEYVVVGTAGGKKYRTRLTADGLERAVQRASEEGSETDQPAQDDRFYYTTGLLGMTSSGSFTEDKSRWVTFPRDEAQSFDERNLKPAYATKRGIFTGVTTGRKLAPKPKPVTPQIREASRENEDEENERDFATLSNGKYPESGVRETNEAGSGQLSLFAAPTADKREAYADLYGTIIKPRTIAHLKASSNSVKAPEDVAHLLASIRKNAQEALYAVVADKRGKVLRVILHTRGLKDQSSVSPLTLIAEVASIPGAAQVHLAHNHPSGDPTPSRADIAITDKIRSLMGGTGISLGHHVVVAGQSWRNVDAPNQAATKIEPLARTVSVPVTERAITKQGSVGDRITTPGAAARVTAGHRDAVFLLNTQNDPVGIVPLTADEMKELRSGGRVNRLLSAINTTNASAAIIKTDDRSAAINVIKFLRQFDGGDIRVLDWIGPDGVSAANSNDIALGETGPFLSRGQEASPETINVDGVDRPTQNSDGQPIHPTEEGIRSFWEWFSGSVVVDDQGRPLVLYHGTTNDFDTFDRSRGNIESDMGAGFYFSNTPEDVANNYAGDGPDLTQRIELLAERIFDDQQDDVEKEMTMDVARSIAREQLSQGKPNTMPVYLSMKNPVTFGGKGETFFDYTEEYNEELDEYGEPTGKLVEFIDALRWVAGDDRYGDVDVDKVAADLYDKAGMEGLKASDLLETAKGSEGLQYALDYDSDAAMASNEILRAAFEKAGFDGVIDHTVAAKFGPARKIGKAMKGVHKGTVHYIAFRDVQIKSATGNTGEFSGSDARIHKSAGKGRQGKHTVASVTSSIEDKLGKGVLSKIADNFKIVKDMAALKADMEARGSKFAELVASKEGFLTKGLYDPSTDTSYIVAANLSAEDSPYGMFLHEVGEHYGLERMLGPEAYKGVLNQAQMILRAGSKAMREAAVRVNASENVGLDPDAKNFHRLFADKMAGNKRLSREVIAYLADNPKNHELPFMRRIMVAVREFMRKLGFTKPLTTDDIVSLITTAARRSGEFSQRRGEASTETIKFGGEARPTTNSEGQPIHPTEDGIRNFWRWFGGSRVVDADGKPLVVYHGTNADLTDFDTAPRGSFFTDSQQVASGYGRPVPVYLAMKNPVIIDAKGAFWNELDTVDSPALDELRKYGRVVVMDHIKSAAEKAGYDGAIVMNVVDNGGATNQYIAFRPEQIKSVIGNQGSYDPSDPSILRSSGQRTAAQAIAQQTLFSRKNLDEAGSLVGSKFTLPAETFAQKAQRYAQDEANRFQVVQDAVVKQGGTVDESSNIADAIKRYPGRLAAAMKDTTETLVEPFAKRIHDAGTTTDEVSLLAYAEHAPERNAEIAKINPRFPNDGTQGKSGSGMTDQEAADIIKQVKAMPNAAEMFRLSQELRDITDQNLDNLVAGGEMEQSQADEYRKRYKFYVPLKGFELVDESGMTQPTGKGLSTGSRLGFRAMGRESRAGQIFEHVIQDYENGLMLSEKAVVAKTLRNFIKANPDDALWTIDNAPKKPRLEKGGSLYQIIAGGNLIAETASKDYADRQVQALLPTDPTAYVAEVKPSPKGLVKWRDSPFDPEEEIRFIENGKPVRIQLSDSGMVRSYNRLWHSQVSDGLRLLNSYNGWLRQMYTQKNPAWFFMNAQKDVLSVMPYVTGEAGIKTALKVPGNIPGAFKAAWAFHHGKTAGAKWNALIDQFKATGGYTGFAFVGDIEAQTTRLNGAIARHTGWDEALGKFRTKGAKAGISAIGAKVMNTAFFSWIEAMNSTFENMTRLAVFKSALDSGMTPNEAGKLAKNASTNFNTRGEWGPNINAVWLFANAGIQGTRNVGHALMFSPHKEQVWALMGGLVALGVMTGLMSDDDDDLLDDQIRSKSLVFKVGDTQLSLPMPYGFGFFSGFGQLAAQAMKHPEKRDNIALKMATLAFDHFSPVGDPLSGEADLKNVVNIAPTSIRPVLNVAANVSPFGGGPLFPESPYDETKPDSTKMWTATRGTGYDNTAKWLNALTGGDQYKAGAISVSPETLKLSVSTLFGGAGKLASDVLSLPFDVYSETLAPSKVPLLKNYIREVDQKAYLGRFYEQAQEAQDAYTIWRRYLKAGMVDEATSYKQGEAAMISMGGLVSSYRKQIKALREMESMTVNSDLSSTEKNLRLAKTNAAIVKITTAFDERLKDFR